MVNSIQHPSRKKLRQSEPVFGNLGYNHRPALLRSSAVSERLLAEAPRIGRNHFAAQYHCTAPPRRPTKYQTIQLVTLEPKFQIHPLNLNFTTQHTKGQAIYRRYGRFFAEFLNEHCPGHLGILSPSTCVGLRYGRQIT